MNYKDYIATYPDFPKEGIMFRDVTPLLADANAFNSAVIELTSMINEADVVVAPESRGYLFGVPIAQKLCLPFVPVRKPGKLPGKVISQKYSLEYGTGTLEMPANSIKPGQKVVIVDDLLATGGTIKAICEMVEKMGGYVSQALCLIELPDLKGRKLLSNYVVDTLVSYEGE